MTLVRRAFFIGFFATLILLFLPPTVWADDCSDPTDCSNTAWTVGGAAAGAGGAAAGAAAGGLLPGRDAKPEPGGSRDDFTRPDCRDKLKRLMADVQAVKTRLAELVTSYEGAHRRFVEADGRAQRLAQQANQMADALGIQWQGGSPTPTSTPGATAIAGDTVTASGVAVSVGGETVFGAGAKVANPALGVIGLLFTGESYRASGVRPGQVADAAQRAREAQLATLERDRWRRFMEKMDRRMQQERQELQRAVFSYNGEAARCGAKPISYDDNREWLVLISKMKNPIRKQTPGPATASIPAPRSVTGAPEPLDSDEKQELPACQQVRQEYDPLVRQIESQRTRWRNTVAEYRRWKDRHKSIVATLQGLKDDVPRYEAAIAKYQDARTAPAVATFALGAVGIFASGGVAAFAAVGGGIAGMYIRPAPDVLAALVGQARPMIPKLQVWSVKAQTHLNQLRSQLATYEANHAQMVARANALRAECPKETQYLESLRKEVTWPLDLSYQSYPGNGGVRRFEYFQGW